MKVLAYKKQSSTNSVNCGIGVKNKKNVYDKCKLNPNIGITNIHAAGRELLKARRRHRDD